MKIVIIYVGYSGYFCACCRALASRDNLQLRVFARKPKVPFSADITEGSPLVTVTDDDYSDYSHFTQQVLAEKPDVIILPGWELSVGNKILRDKRFDSIRKLAIVDTSWKCSFRQIGARFLLHGFVRRIDGIIVGGERGRVFARWVGFPPEKIFVSAYGCDYELFSRAQIGLKRENSYLFVARYVHQKGLDTLVSAYRKYREEVSDPWALNCYGSGPLKHLLNGIDGIVEHGFAQPSVLPQIFESNGVYVLPSLNEPWGVSLAEAAAGGMPLVCSDMVTSGVDVVRHMYNGLVFPSGNVEALKACLLWCHRNHNRLCDMGRFSRNFANAFSAEMWAERIVWACERSIQR